MKVDSSAWRDPNDSDIVGQLFVLKDDKILILKRADWMAWAPGQWALPGGHIQYGEDIETGAARELKEETDLIALSMEHFESDDHLHYFIVDEFDGYIKLNEEHTGYEWVTIEDLDHFDIVPNVKKRIQNLFNVVR
tara:strand:- start:2405 stop:2812 length:408 start_codon:yes stop_codon:yes gene_type:complete